MEKKPRKRKTFDIHLDTKKVDVDIKRDANGKLTVDVDTEKIDAHFEKSDEGVILDVDINDEHEYEFEANGKSQTLPKGTVWKITGEMLKIFLKQGFGKLKK